MAQVDCRPFAPLQLLHRCGPPLRARRRSRTDGRAHRAHHRAGAADLRHARDRLRPRRRPEVQHAPAQARHAARGACGQGHRHAAHAAAMPRCAGRPGPAGGAGRWRAHRHAAQLPLRHQHRGRPDRGSGAHGGLREPAHDQAAGAHCAQAARRKPPQPVRRAPRAGRSGLPGNHQLQLCGSRVGEGSGWQRQSHPAAQPDRKPAQRDALQPHRLAHAGAQVQCRPQGRARARVRAGPCLPQG